MNDITYVEHFPVILPTEKYQDLSNKHLQRRSTIIKITAVTSQPAFPCSKLTIETLEQGLKYA